MRDEFELVRTLRRLKMECAQLDRPEGVPVPVWVVLQDTLSINPQARPTVGALLSNVEKLHGQYVGECYWGGDFDDVVSHACLSGKPDS
jgi:hypothetical protein